MGHYRHEASKRASVVRPPASGPARSRRSRARISSSPPFTTSARPGPAPGSPPSTADLSRARPRARALFGERGRSTRGKREQPQPRHTAEEFISQKLGKKDEHHHFGVGAAIRPPWGSHTEAHHTSPACTRKDARSRQRAVLPRPLRRSPTPSPRGCLPRRKRSPQGWRAVLTWAHSGDSWESEYSYRSIQPTGQRARIRSGSLSGRELVAARTSRPFRRVDRALGFGSHFKTIRTRKD